MDVTNAIVKVYVTERTDVIIRHSNGITIWQTSSMEMTALLKKLHSVMKNVQEKESVMGVRVDRKKIRSLGMPGSDPRDRFFYLPLLPIINPYNIPQVIIFTDIATALRKHAYSNILKILSPNKEHFQIKNSGIFLMSALNIDCGYSLEPPLQGVLTTTHNLCF